jgi:hypothetical protein
VVAPLLCLLSLALFLVLSRHRRMLSKKSCSRACAKLIVLPSRGGRTSSVCPIGMKIIRGSGNNAGTWGGTERFWVRLELRWKVGHCRWWCNTTGV